MKVYLVYNEYSDGWKDLQAVFDTEEQAEAFSKEKNGDWGTIATFELNDEKGQIWE